MNNIILNYLRPNLFCYNFPVGKKKQNTRPGRGKAVYRGSAGLPIDDIIDPQCESGGLEHLWALVNFELSSR